MNDQRHYLLTASIAQSRIKPADAAERTDNFIGHFSGTTKTPEPSYAELRGHFCSIFLP